MKTPGMCINSGCPNLSRTKKPGLCMRCYQDARRKRPVCRSSKCRVHLWPGQSKLGFCRLHEAELFSKWDTAAHRAAWVRFAKQVERDPESGCWEAVTHLVYDDDSKHPYGRISLNDAWWVIHRFSYVWTYGGHSNGLELDHRCNNTVCANPTHLFPTTSTRNIGFRDQRAREPDAEWDLLDPKGEPIVSVINERLMLAMFWTGLDVNPD